MVAIMLEIGNGNCKSWSSELSSNFNIEMIGSLFPICKVNIYMFTLGQFMYQTFYDMFEVSLDFYLWFV